MEKENSMSLPSTRFQGSLYQRQDGYWVAALTVNGRRIVRYARTQRAAKEKLASLQREHYLGTLAHPTKLTVADWIEEWLRQGETTLRPSTLRVYRQVLTLVLGYIGSGRLDHLTPVMVAGALNSLRRKGRGSRQLQLAYTYLRTALQRAVDLGMLGHNPAAKAPKPRHEPSERHYWSAEEMRRFLAVAQGSHYQHASLLAFLLGSGLRISEALGLRWEDVDMGQGLVHVRRAVVYAGQEATLQRPKTKAGERTVTLPDFALDLLRRKPRPLTDDAPVFTTTTSTTPTPGVIRDTLVLLCDQAQVPFVNVHGLRHCHAALLLSQGLDLQVLRRRLGHATVDMSVNRYAYALRPDSDAAEAVQQALN